MSALTPDLYRPMYGDKIGFVKYPFDRMSFGVKDGRKAVLHNSGFGTVYGIVVGKPLPCDGTSNA